jgi:hypothetical protein
VVDLTPDNAAGIDEYGGTMLGTSRGNQHPEDIVDCLEQVGANDPDGDLWMSVLEATGQPTRFGPAG